MIKEEIILKKWQEYIEQFDTNDKGIAIKISHTKHVVDLANKLAKRMNLDEEQTMLIKTIGLLHDLGRFPQYEKTKQYNDTLTHIDHAQLANNYLFLEGHIKDFEIPEKYHEIIKKAIYNHNKLEIEDNLTEEELFYAKLIRDIDKIDIFRVSATNYEFTYEKNLTKKVKETFDNKKLIDDSEKQNDSDRMARLLAFIFDINFKESYELLNDTDNLELFLSSVEVKKGFEQEFDELKEKARKYLEEKVN